MFSKKQRVFFLKKRCRWKSHSLICKFVKMCFMKVMKVATVADSWILRGNLFQCLGAAALEGSISVSHQTSTRLLK